MDPAILLRAIRRAHALSQRELARRTGVPLSTIERLEAGHTRTPSLGTIEQILRGTGYTLVVRNGVGQDLALEPVHPDIVDKAGRQFPAHLEAVRLERTWVSWRGWYRWPYYDVRRTPPEWIYYGRRPRVRWAADREDRPWGDAT